jgi:hypothetical protein
MLKPIRKINCYDIWSAERGDIKIRLLDKTESNSQLSFVNYLVAEVNFVQLDKDPKAKEFVLNSRIGLANWFASPAYQHIYFQNIKNKKTTPDKEWQRIKTQYNLTDKFDVLNKPK